jgi:hypothetical protein
VSLQHEVAAVAEEATGVLFADRPVGLDQDRADLITYRVLKVMIKDPAGASQFTKAVAQVP